MQKKTQDLLKKFEQDYEIYVDAHDEKSYWLVTARIPNKQDTHHRSRRYISGHNEEGNVIIFIDPDRRDTYTIENWGTMETFEDFVDKTLTAILADMEEWNQKLKEGCGTDCD